jgi:hypothetical protein
MHRSKQCLVSAVAAEDAFVLRVLQKEESRMRHEAERGDFLLPKSNQAKLAYGAFCEGAEDG